MSASGKVLEYPHTSSPHPFLTAGVCYEMSHWGHSFRDYTTADPPQLVDGSPSFLCSQPLQYLALSFPLTHDPCLVTVALTKNRLFLRQGNPAASGRLKSQ